VKPEYVEALEAWNACEQTALRARRAFLEEQLSLRPDDSRLTTELRAIVRRLLPDFRWPEDRNGDR